MALVVWLAGCSGESASLDAPGPGDPFPAIRLPALEGGAVDFVDYRGRVVVLNVWATWCAPCREEMPSLQRLSERFPGKALVVFGLSVDEDLNLVREFLLDFDITFPILVDPAGAVAEGLLGVTAYPDTLVLGPDGRIVERRAGIRDWSADEVVARLARLAAGAEDRR